MSDLLIFTESFSARHEYVFRTIFRDRLGLAFNHTTDPEVFGRSTGNKISYSTRLHGAKLQIIPSGILDATGHASLNPSEGKWDQEWILFASENQQVPFDLPGAVFFLLSRYEEYDSSDRDEHDRFKAKNSILFTAKQLDKPIVDRWIAKLGEVLKACFPSLNITVPAFSSTATVDIDNAWAYRNKGFVRNVGGFWRDLFKGRMGDVGTRLQTWFGGKDPYDTYEYIRSACQNNSVDLRFFFLLADRGPNDKNPSPDNARYRRLIQELSKAHGVGIHPGYRSYCDPYVTEMEMDRLRKIIGQEVEHSRQHFLRVYVPETYRILRDAGIQHDHSMGYAEVPGFRAGTSMPFSFYDISSESDTMVVVHPFAYMDGTLCEYMELDPDSARKKVDDLLKEVKAVNGHFEFIWHNETLNDRGKWKGWRSVFEHTIKACN